MKLSVYDNDKCEFVFEADGCIRRFQSSDGGVCAVAVFDKSIANAVIGMQRGLIVGDRCVITDGEEVVRGTYLTNSRIDGNPIVRVVEEKPEFSEDSNNNSYGKTGCDGHAADGMF